MGLPWVRLDANIGTHDKVLDLLDQKDGCKAFVLYVCSLGYAGGHSTDGRIPKSALAINHGTDRLARMLVDARLWEYDPVEPAKAFRIRNYELRQELGFVSDAKRSAARTAGRKGACIRHHGPDCHCWKNDG
jgi:hypothetical protein